MMEWYRDTVTETMDFPSLYWLYVDACDKYIHPWDLSHTHGANEDRWWADKLQIDISDKYAFIQGGKVRSESIYLAFNMSERMSFIYLFAYSIESTLVV